MQNEIRIINLGVNCYLLKADEGYILVDTGFSSKRAKLENELVKAGCRPGSLKLIVLTHGDFDHAGNCAFLRDKYGAQIAMHQDDSGMVEYADMSWNRKARPDRSSPVFGIMMKITGPLNKLVKFERFKPDIYVEDRYDLKVFGLNAHILHLPGHSKGSIGVLTADGNLICGDLVYNFAGFDCIFNLEEFRSSIGKLKDLNIKIVYPGHGKPMTWDQAVKKYGNVMAD